MDAMTLSQLKAGAQMYREMLGSNAVAPANLLALEREIARRERNRSR